MAKQALEVANNEGYHNKNLEASIDRLHRGASYKNLSTIWITPTRGVVKAKVISSWMALQKPMNQPFYGPLFMENMEVGEAYQKGFELIVDNPELSKFKYILTIEEDNLPPSDGLMMLYESIQHFDVVGGLYWTKGINGQPMIYGNPHEHPRNFVPQKPVPNAIQRCNGLGMGFNLFRMEIFKKMPRPWFKTVQTKNQTFSQDLWFYNNIAAEGYKVACDTRCKVGHIDDQGVVW